MIPCPPSATATLALSLKPTGGLVIQPLKVIIGRNPGKTLIIQGNWYFGIHRYPAVVQLGSPGNRNIRRLRKGHKVRIGKGVGRRRTHGRIDMQGLGSPGLKVVLSVYSGRTGLLLPQQRPQPTAVCGL
jgi:hypothetical protein